MTWGRTNSEARTTAFLYRYRIAFSASRPHRPSTHLKKKKSREKIRPSTINQARLGVISGEIADQSVVQGCGFELGTREARVPKPWKPFTLLEIPRVTAHFGLPSCLALAGTNHVGDCDDQFLGLVRSLGLAESHSVNLNQGSQPRLIAHSYNTGGNVIERRPPEHIEAVKIFLIFFSTRRPR